MRSRLPDGFHNHPHLHRHVHPAAGIGGSGFQPLTKMGIMVNPLLELAVGCLGIKMGEIAYGQFRAPIGADGKFVLFHKSFCFLISVLFFAIKILKNNGIYK